MRLQDAVTSDNLCLNCHPMVHQVQHGDRYRGGGSAGGDCRSTLENLRLCKLWCQGSSSVELLVNMRRDLRHQEA